MSQPLETRLKPWERRGEWTWGILAAAGLGALLAHHSMEPYVGRWSLPYLFLVAAYLLMVAGLGFWIRSRGIHAQLILFANLFCWLLLLALMEAAGQVYARFHPAYSTLFLEPDPVLGWRHIPNSHWIKTDYYWYARQFSNRIDINEYGWRDAPRSLSKPAGTARVALLGDSLVEAVQVSLPKTAGGLLEADLRRHTGRAWEALNFGTSNYGVGQFYLSWRESGRRFSPDIVVALVAGFHMHRTVMPMERSVTHSGGPRELSIRPTFEWKNGALTVHPPRDYAEFQKAQEFLVNNEMSGQRTRRIPPRGFFLKGLKDRLFGANGLLLHLQHNLGGDKVDLRNVMKLWPDFDEATLDLNLKILRELGRDAQARGARFAVADVHAYAHRWDHAYVVSDPRSKALPATLRALCRENGFGYIPLSDALLEANRKGVTTQWMDDGHFNEEGNRIFAKAMRDWILTDEAVAVRRYPAVR